MKTSLAINFSTIITVSFSETRALNSDVHLSFSNGGPPT